jgi:PAP2 superfamily
MLPKGLIPSKKLSLYHNILFKYSFSINDMNFRFIIFGLFAFVACKNSQTVKVNPLFQNIAADPTIYHKSVKSLTDVMVHDIFSPPVASRIYTYASIAGYEAGRHSDSSLESLSGTIQHLPPSPKPEIGKEYCYPMAATMAFLKVGRTLIFSEDTLNKQITNAEEFYRNTGMPIDVYERTMSYADTMVKHIITWSGGDNYKQSRSFPKFSLDKELYTWKPTPPGYGDAVEPSWNKIRPFLMDSAAMFKPEPPTAFDIKNKKSKFYKEALEVYKTGKNLTDEQKEIANFWDCNPYKLNVTGHIMHATKKISPGGHWINIVGQVCIQANALMPKTLQTYVFVSLGLADAFISCWDEKYRSKLIRPESIINEHIDQEWIPFLQTPPFPEYTSGHSVASAACATILTQLMGDNFAYSDSTEVEFGLPVRKFTSFEHAASEASISRLYGGIHYMPAITNGVAQGKKIGLMVLKRMVKN